MKSLPRAEFSRIHGVDRSAVSHAVKRGTLASTPDGEVDLEDRITLDWVLQHRIKVAKKQAKVKTPTAVKKIKQPSTPKTAKGPKTALKPTPPVAEPPQNLHELMEGGGDLPALEDIKPDELGRYPKAAIDKLRSYETGLKIQQDRQAKRGELIPRDLVAAVFGKLHSIDSSQLKNLEERLLPLICSVAGFSDDDPRALKIQKIINKETSQALKHAKRLTGKFLASNPEPHG